MWTLTIRDCDGDEVIGVLVLEPKTFTTGSRGLFGSRKITVAGGRYQVQAQAVLIGSRAGPTDGRAESELLAEGQDAAKIGQ